MKLQFGGAVVAALAAFASATAQSPDRVLYNGMIWTGDSARPAATAVAIRGGVITAIGSDEEVRASAGPATRSEDLGGRQVLPGFHDAHWHLPGRPEADLTGATHQVEIVARLRAFAAALPPNAWITGRGWTPDMFPDNTAHRRYLDAAFPDRPVLITDRDGHQVLANSRAMTLAKIDVFTRAPSGGRIVRGYDDTPTGLLQETAMGLVRRMLPEPSASEMYGVLRDQMHRAAALGLTSLQVANGLDEAESEAFERALHEDSMIVRFRVAVPFTRGIADSTLRMYTTLRDVHTGLLLRYGVAKGMLDGTVDAGTAAMLAPYAIRGGTGLPRWTQADLNATLAKYDSAGIQVELHAIGDRAIRMALDAFQDVAKRNGPRDRRGRVEHIEVPDPADIPRFAALGVIASTQAIFASPDPTSLENYAPLLGPQRASRAMPFKAFDDAGAVQAFGSDYPVFPMDPILGVYTAVTRQMPNGTPAGGWYPQHRITVEAAVRHYTAGSAFAEFRENEIGMLRAGMLADLVVLSSPIVGATAETILNARPVLTIVGGRDSYRAIP
ncbi:MAG TPA: amidohydrolase [Gemmatimonadaceae bacterium]|nr:amidohydrolase [Gemmatimonadaceae bacterium]